MFVNSPMRIYNILNACFNKTGLFRNRFAVDTYNWQVNALIWNFDTRLLLLFLKCHVDKPVNSG